ncbi:MAG: cytochrome c family protein [Desulfosarcinaceae bacterium]|nr:cytochrome c family protein [Desulfosarcinaceae bacterium]
MEFEKPFNALLFLLVIAVLHADGMVSMGFATGEPVYVGSETCGGCHPDQFEAFTEHSKKANSFTSVKRMATKLTPEELKGCYGCHTTGYGKTGGFRSEQETPHLKDTGCEVCHGPGSVHAESEDPSDLNAVIDVEDCMKCHNSERIGAFNFKPLLYGGAH